MGLRGRVRRLERKAKGETVSIEQRDGTTATFPARMFWHRLLLDQLDAATGETPSSPVAEAIEGATEESRGRIERIVASGQAGDFLRGNGEGGLLEVADPVDDLSEPA
jgi:hypothetical protein